MNREMVNKSMTLAPIPEKTERNKNNVDDMSSNRKKSIASNPVNDSSPKGIYNNTLIGSRTQTSGKLI